MMHMHDHQDGHAFRTRSFEFGYHPQRQIGELAKIALRDPTPPPESCGCWRAAPPVRTLNPARIRPLRK